MEGVDCHDGRGRDREFVHRLTVSPSHHLIISPSHILLDSTKSDSFLRDGILSGVDAYLWPGPNSCYLLMPLNRLWLAYCTLLTHLPIQAHQVRYGVSPGLQSTNPSDCLSPSSTQLESSWPRESIFAS